jgi:hypothetical protein
MSIEHVIRAVAGTFILASLLLGTFVHTNWYYLALLVGANLLQSAFTKWCFLEDLLRKHVYHTEKPR